MQKKKVVWAGIISLFVIIALGGLVSACFSPWKGDMGAFSIAIGNGGSGGSSRAVLPWDDSIDSNDLQHVIKLSGGPGPDQTRTITGSGTVNFTVTPGNWYITVEAYSVEKSTEGGPPAKSLTAFSARSVNIKSGLNGTVSMEMWQVVSYWYDLESAIVAGASTIALNGAYPYADWGVGSTDPITINRPVTLIAVNNIDMTRLSGGSSFFSIEGGGSLTLQAARGCTLILDGGGEANSGAPSLISVDNGGALVMNDGVKLLNNYSGTSTYGGAVSIGDYGSIFTMNGGTIAGNTAGSGGGVAINAPNAGGSFIMRGGTISGNTAFGNGGGVYVGSGGRLRKTGGIIYGSDDVEGNANISTLPGQAVYVTPDATGSVYTNRTQKQRDTTAGPSVNLDSDSAAWPK